MNNPLRVYVYVISIFLFLLSVFYIVTSFISVQEDQVVICENRVNKNEILFIDKPGANYVGPSFYCAAYPLKLNTDYRLSDKYPGKSRQPIPQTISIKLEDGQEIYIKLFAEIRLPDKKDKLIKIHKKYHNYYNLLKTAIRPYFINNTQLVLKNYSFQKFTNTDITLIQKEINNYANNNDPLSNYTYLRDIQIVADIKIEQFFPDQADDTQQSKNDWDPLDYYLWGSRFFYPTFLFISK